MSIECSSNPLKPPLAYAEHWVQDEIMIRASDNVTSVHDPISFACASAVTLPAPVEPDLSLLADHNIRLGVKRIDRPSPP
jgi:hypothetical protein